MMKNNSDLILIIFIILFFRITPAQTIQKFPEVNLEAFRKDVLDRARREEERKKTAEVIGEINQKFAIPAQYSNKYANFLKHKRTGLARIFPDQQCNEKTVISVDEIERCADVPPVKGGGSLYSFRFNEVPDYVPLEKLIDLFAKSDIYFANQQLKVGTSTIQAVISEIREMKIDEISHKHQAFKFLKKLKWVKTKTAFQRQKKELEQGASENGYFYSTTVKIGLNKVYAMRSISYYQDRITFWNTDQTVVFQVVGLEKDESIIVLWRILKDEMAPLIKVK